MSSGVIIENPNKETAIFTFANGSLKVTIQQGDLSRAVCDAIVNPTNSSMIHNGGLDTKIHTKMGQYFTDQVVAINNKLGQNACPVGQSRIFISRFNREESIPQFIINTVGPFYKKEEHEQGLFHLQSCYYTSLALANLYSLSSIAYPAISCGAFKFPLNEAAKVGIKSVREYSNQVKDVRFILYDSAVFDVFVQEWTNYSQQINKEANVDNDRDRCRTPPPPTPPPSAARHCIVCKQKQLQQNQPHLCNNCSNLTRPDMFKQFLQQLRFAAEKSLGHLQEECTKLKPLLSSYPLVYMPIEVFDQSIHRRDPVAEYYLQVHCDKKFRNAMPMSIIGDGNCFYNSFVKLGGASATLEGSSLTSVELRARNIVELVLNQHEYQNRHNSLFEVLDPFEQYVTEEMVRDANYVAIWDFLSIPTVLNVNVISIYPKVNGDSDTYYTKVNDHQYQPLSSVNLTTTDQSNSTIKDVRILFSNCNKPVSYGSNQGKGWTPNHFVPVLSLR
ncbi:hypothetical protein I4U23_024741 [Adineta vaga]|nr:hypothetical protein I4U23_024741 [Adineta vaga]